MRKLTLLFCLSLLVLLLSSKSSHCQKPKVNVTIRVFGYCTDAKYCTPFKFNALDTAYLIEVVITNTSSRTIRFGTMSCGFYGTIIIDSKGFDICGWKCNKNIPIGCELKPKSKCTNYLFVHKTRYDAKKLRIAFHFMDADQYLNNAYSWLKNEPKQTEKIKDIKYISNECEMVATRRINYFDGHFFECERYFPH